MTRTFLFVIAALAVLVGGISVGQLFRSEPPAPTHPEVSYEPDMDIGDVFPDIDLVDASGASHSTRSLLVNRGAVVLFVDPDCPPCSEVVARWQGYIDAGRIDREDVIGIGMRAPEALSEYRSAHGLTFATYSDLQGRFQHEYGVNFFPMELVVGMSGEITALRQGTVEPIDVASVYDLIAR